MVGWAGWLAGEWWVSTVGCLCAWRWGGWKEDVDVNVEVERKFGSRLEGGLGVV